MKEHLDLLGLKVEDLVTGVHGVVTSVTFDLFGCIQALVNPGVGKDGKPMDLMWFDVERLVVLSPNPVMPQPTFAAYTPGGKKGGNPKGPEHKPLPHHA